MMRLFWPPFLIVALFLFGFSSVSGQAENLRVAVANMSQDLQLLDQQVRTLRLEIEEMRRENIRLKSELEAALSNLNSQGQIRALADDIRVMRNEFRSADELNKTEIVSEVSKQIEVLATETQEAINAVANAISSQPQISAPVHFSEDYPKSGVTYTVRSGDTLSKIAREHKSTIKHIQNANQIANPSRDLRVGQTIFIPIAE